MGKSHSTAAWRPGVLFKLIGPASMIGFAAVAVSPAHAQSGYQTINGTQVFTVVNQAAGVATFSNNCGSQTLTQRQLQAGAIPNAIIPCPRSGSTASPGAPSVPSGNNSLAVGPGLFSGALGVAKTLQDVQPGASSYGDQPRPSAPSAPTGSIDGSQQGAVAVSLYNQASDQSRIKKYCAAAKMFRSAAEAFHNSGDDRRANDALFQASMTDADCKDATRKREDEKNVYYCVDEDNVYGKAWIPKHPGEGCGPEQKPVTAPKGSDTAGALRKKLREQLAKQKEMEKSSEGTAGVPDKDGPAPPTDTNQRQPAQTTPSPEPQRADVAAKPKANDEALENYLDAKKNGYSNRGHFDPPQPQDTGLTPADNASPDPEPAHRALRVSHAKMTPRISSTPFETCFCGNTQSAANV